MPSENCSAPTPSSSFNQSPLEKLEYVRRLQSAGKTVLMVGDGLNDAGAFQQSDVGVAVVERIGAFSPASDVILDAEQVPALADLPRFARRTIWVVRLSLGCRRSTTWWGSASRRPVYYRRSSALF
jgi:P-type Cu+ transporter